ncbi:hypothetical protein T552_03360 [Pneumocystis carinii B80]|uniref:Rad4 beta-hairpin domain-containing protein n=1 Tax=Pneumocystis carinii (strain B80) TaxID=1408658 RepID=A0A0W4ZBM7_PNEC8|nr:hypothetical protein T552_03360 [Pneumocystis carinii B80]KTW25747.1 hypothetical protein T552_03360 [Pneumocystis carinii B80]
MSFREDFDIEESFFSGEKWSDGSFFLDTNSPSSRKRKKRFEDESEDDMDEDEVEWEDFGFESEDGEKNTGKKEDECSFEYKIKEELGRKRYGIKEKDRKLRLEIHKLHLLCLISHASLRNFFCRDKRLQAKLKVILPDEIRELFHPGAKISQYRKSRMFMTALKAIVNIWKRKFRKNKYGLSRSLWRSPEQIDKFQIGKSYDNIYCFEDFLKAAEELQGSRDLGAQLFVAFLRSNNVKTRLTVFLQPLSYGFDKSNPLHDSTLETFNKNNISILKDNCIDKEKDKHSNCDVFHTNEESIRSIRRFNSSHLNHFITNSSNNNSIDIKESLHPFYWAEVLNPITQKWIFVDPMVSYLIGKPSKFESLVSKSKNSLSYIISFDEDGYVKDVTRRYTRHFNSKVRKQRLESVAGGEEWWENVLNFYRSGYINQPYDIIEDEEFMQRQAYEKIPQNIKDLKDHPLFIIERHLKRNQFILSRKPCSFLTIKRNGIHVKEPIFHRKDIVTVLSATKWYQLGRKIKFGEQPLKIVPDHRKIADLDQLNTNIQHETIGLYSESQTELYIPPSVINGKVPRNAYGNLDIFVPSMIPQGAIHLPFSGISLTAKILGIDYADAVVGFKFEKRLSLPIIKGIIIAKEYEEAISLAFKIMKEEEYEKISLKLTNIILARWKRFYRKLSICERLKQYDIKHALD